MQLQAFLNAVKKMRQHQIAFFKERRMSDLLDAKQWEQTVDRALKEGVTVVLEQPEQVKPLLEADNETQGS